MVSKVSPHHSAVAVTDSIKTTGRQINNIDDEEMFETDTSQKVSDTYQSSSPAKKKDTDDGKISTGDFWSEYFKGSWNQLKKQGKELLNSVKKHPVLSAVVVGGTILGATFIPAVATALGAASLVLGGYELIKDAVNGKKAYDNYKNAKTDADAKQQARNMGAQSLNCVEDAGMIVLGGKAIWKPAKNALTKSIKWAKKLFNNKPKHRFNLKKKQRAVNTINAAQIAGVILSNTDDALRATSLMASTIENNKDNDEQKNHYSEITTIKNKKK